MPEISRRTALARGGQAVAAAARPVISNIATDAAEGDAGSRVTQHEREKMLRLRMDKGMNNVQIARAVGRAVTSVTDSIGRKNSTPLTAKWRKCQMCHNRFLSSWAGNRRCEACLKLAGQMSSSLES